MFYMTAMPTNPDIDRVIFESPTVSVGQFRCRPWHPRFENTGPINGYLVVFPRTSVCITHAGGRPIVTDPNVVMFYNHQQRYRRSKVSDRGDLCEWFAFDPQIVAETIQRFDPRVADRKGSPFTLTHGPSDPQTYLLQRLVVEQLLGAAPDGLFVAETMLLVLGRVIALAYRAHGTLPAGGGGMKDFRQELAHATQEFLARTFQEQISLEAIARAVAVSPYHLCRVFHRQTGMTIHAYLNQIRLRTALEYVAQADADLATLGVSLGYSSHSHFTQAFRRAFGIAPSELRGRASSRSLRELRNILIA
jgi:AraC family transcriptional regulator